MQGEKAQDVQRGGIGPPHADGDEDEQGGEREDAQDAVIDKRQVADGAGAVQTDEAEEEAAQHEEEADTDLAVIHPQFEDFYRIGEVVAGAGEIAGEAQVEDKHPQTGGEAQVIKAREISKVGGFHDPGVVYLTRLAAKGFSMV